MKSGRMPIRSRRQVKSWQDQLTAKLTASGRFR